MHIKNLTNSPYELFTADGGKSMLPARGEIDIDPHELYESYYRQCGYFEITESSATPDPSPVVEEKDPRDALREQYKELSGENADKRWSESRLREEIRNLSE